jgi:hypothetical protein
MHSYETIPHPVALDHQFTGAIGADDLPREKAKRLADQEGDANYDTTYDDAFEYAGPSFDESVELDEAEDLQELSIGTLSKYVQKKVGKNARASEALKAYYALTKVQAFNNLGKADKDAAMKVIKDQEALVKKSEKGINLAKLKATAKADKLGIDIIFGKDGKSMSRSKISMDEDFKEQADQAIMNRLSEGSAMAKSAALSKASAPSKSGKAKVSLKKAPWDKNEEVDLDEASARDARIAAALGKSPAKKYEIKDNKIHISKANFRKVHKDYKNATKGKERMVALDPKTGGTSSFPVVFTESVDLEEGFSPKQIEQLKKAYASMPDRLPVDAAQKMGAILKGRSKEELIAIARADIKWLSTTAATNLIMQGVKAKEING